MFRFLTLNHLKQIETTEKGFIYAETKNYLTRSNTIFSLTNTGILLRWNIMYILGVCRPNSPLPITLVKENTMNNSIPLLGYIQIC